MIIFGGYPYKNDLWWYDPSSGTTGAWIDMTTTAISPSIRMGHSMVWDPMRNMVIMFGGSGSMPPYKNDLWWYDSSSGTHGAWAKMIDQDAPGSPSARSNHAMVWDPVRNVMIMFGGFNGPTYYNDLWWYDPSSGTSGAWTKMIDNGVVGSPSARRGHSMVWDPMRNMVIMFGGTGGASGNRNDLWWYDSSSGTHGAWAKMIDQDAPGSPSVRYGHAMVWDPVRNVMIMFSGSSANDLWWYDPSLGTSGAWIKHINSFAPGSPSRYGHSMVWDPVQNVMIMFGGQHAYGQKNDIWWWW
jgi:hypothetical protein